MAKISPEQRIGRSPNEAIVLQLLRKHGSLSQAQICELAHLRSSTVSYITARLREKNLVVEKPGQSSRRGAKPVMLSINPQGRFIFGVSIDPGDVHIGLFDLTCELVEQLTASLNGDNSPENACHVIEINVLGLLGKYGIDQNEVLGVGLVVSGSVSDDGTVKLSSPLGWKDVPLSNLIAEKFDCPVVVHSTKVRLLAEIAANPQLSSSNVLYINVANGVGATVFADGKISSGATGRFAEIGHIVIDPDGPKCGCGQKGCLEVYISGPAITLKILGDIKSGTKTTLANTIVAEDTPEQAIAKWGRAIDQKDEYSSLLRDMAGRYLGNVAATAINCFDPEVVILIGYVIDQAALFFTNSIKKALQTRVYDIRSRQIEIKQATAKEDALIAGVAMAVLRNSVEPA